MEHAMAMIQAKTKEDYWRAHLARQANSGLTQAAYCAREGLKVCNLHYWKRRLGKMAASAAGRTRLRFVPLQTGPRPETAEVPGKARIMIEDLVLEISEDIAAARLKRLISCLREEVGHVAD